MEAQSQPKLRDILNESFLTIPDGMPTVWVGRLQGLQLDRVYGPDFMSEICRLSVQKRWRHFLYGGNEDVAPALKVALETRYPGLDIVGTYTPPFRRLNEQELADLQSQISESGPDVMWIGLSTPKQELFMAEHLSQLDVKLMVGVGAAFDIHIGRIKDAPDIVKRMGLQWAHRLTQDFGRLWYRYLRNNPVFIVKIVLQLMGINKYPIS
jgi:N-acetylglucosaminyldiphosphoundecaprenol N-acetyl-beta-D-mannosaminyltransferase